MVKKQQGSASELLLTFQGGQGEAAKTIDTYRTVYLLSFKLLEIVDGRWTATIKGTFLH